MKRNLIIEELQKQDQTIISFPDRNNEWGDSRYRGNCSGWVQAFLIWKYQVKKFAELFSGSGTGYDVAKDMGVKYIGADMNPNPARPGILQVNAVTDEVPEEFVDADFLFMHPPYGAEIGIPYAGAEWGAEKKWTKINGRNRCTIIDHTDELIPTMGYDPKDYDLGRMEWNKFMNALNAIIMKYYSAMQNGSMMGILMGDVRRNGRFYSMVSDVVKAGRLEQLIIKKQNNTTSERNNVPYMSKNFVPIIHEYIMVLKKIAPYIIDFSLPTKHEGDIRDASSSTWRDVVVAVMNNLGGEAKLEIIYREIDGHKKCLKNKHWKEKVRQTLQQSKLFLNVDRGVWKLA